MIDRQKMREEFEADLVRRDAHACLDREENGLYRHHFVRAAWRTWRTAWYAALEDAGDRSPDALLETLQAEHPNIEAKFTYTPKANWQLWLKEKPRGRHLVWANGHSIEQACHTARELLRAATITGTL